MIPDDGGEAQASPPHAECLAAAKAVLQDEIDLHRKVLFEIADDILQTCHAIRDEYIQKNETLCPAQCGRVVRVEFIPGLARIVLIDPHSNRPHWCALLPISANDYDREYYRRSALPKSTAASNLSVEVERLG